MLHSDGGFTKFPNSLRDAPWRNKPHTVALYFYLRMHANHFENGWNNVALKPGELIIGRESLAKEVGATESQVRTALTHLKSTGHITTKSTNRFTIISFTDKENWDFSRDRIANKTSSEFSNESPADNQQVATVRDPETKKTGEGAKSFSPPSLDEVRNFFYRNKATLEQGEKFFYHYDGLSWKSGSTPIVNWESIARKWILDDASKNDVHEDYDPYAGLPVFGSWDGKKQHRDPTVEELYGYF